MEIQELESQHRAAWHGCAPLPKLGAYLVVDGHRLRVDGYVYLSARHGAGAHLLVMSEKPDGRTTWIPGFSWDDLVARATERSPGTSWAD